MFSCAGGTGLAGGEENPEPRVPGNEKKERHEREGSPEHASAYPGMQMG
jgi:hypothetical protein